MQTLSTICVGMLVCLSTTDAFGTSMTNTIVTNPPRNMAMMNSRSQWSPIMNAGNSLSATTTTTNKRSRSELSMAVEGDFDPDAISRSVEQVKAGSLKARLRAIYKFTRPHTIRGTILASIAGTTRALIDTPGALVNAQWAVMLPRAFIGMIALLCGNAFIVGINQIFDDDIDKLNKPFLPVASGEMSKRFAWVAVATAGIIGPVLV